MLFQIGLLHAHREIDFAFLWSRTLLTEICQTLYTEEYELHHGAYLNHPSPQAWEYLSLAVKKPHRDDIAEALRKTCKCKMQMYGSHGTVQT